MSDTQLEPGHSRDVPDAGPGLLAQNKSIQQMSDTVSRTEFEKVLRQLQRRKAELAEANRRVTEYESAIEQIQAERDEAVSLMEQQTEQFKRFTDENEILKENAALRSELKQIYVEDAVYASLPEGMAIQQGVSVQEILGAAGVNIDELEDFGMETIQEAIGKAQAAKPYLFLSGAVDAQAGQQPAQVSEGEVRQQMQPAAPTQPPLRAFGAQAIGGGSAPESMTRPDPAKSVDWTNPAAVAAYQKQVINK